MLSFLKKQQTRFITARNRFMSNTKKARKTIEKTAKKNPVGKHVVKMRNSKTAKTVNDLASRRVVRKKLRSTVKRFKPKGKKVKFARAKLVGGASCGQHTDAMNNPEST